MKQSIQRGGQILGGALGALAVVLISTTDARADSVFYNLGQGNRDIEGYPAPYASVVVELLSDNKTAHVIFTSATTPSYIYLMGDGTTAGVNVNASTWTLSDLDGANGDDWFTPGPLSNGGSGSTSEFGRFNQTINSFDGYTHSSDKITLTLTNTSGTWAGASDVLKANSDGYFVTSHIFVADADDVAAGALDTGYAGGNRGAPLVVVPLPGAAFMGMGLIGSIGGASYFRRRQQLD